MPARRPGAIVKFDRASQTARRLRREPTYAEALLWKALGRLEEPALHFRRQAPIGPYVVDFVSHRGRVVVEFDGGVHRLPEVAERDLERTQWIEARGFVMVRFDNDDVVADVGGVMQRIIAMAAPTPPPQPLPARGRGSERDR